MEKELANIIDEEIDEEEINKLDDSGNVEKFLFIMVIFIH